MVVRIFINTNFNILTMKKKFTFLAVLIVCSFIPKNIVTAQNLEEGLVIHYKFEDNLKDEISGELPTILNSNFTYFDGQNGSRAVRFIDPDAYFVTPRGKLQVGPAVDGGTPGTFCLFVNHFPESLETERHNYIAQKNGCGPEDNNRGRVVLYRQHPDNATDPDSIISFIGGRPLRTGFKLDVGDTWFHLALTIDPENNEFAFFVNGEEFSRDIMLADAENSCGEFVIGHHLTYGTTTQTFKGLMDDLRFYNRILSQEEISMIAKQFSASVDKVVANNTIKLYPNPVASNQPIELKIDRGVFNSKSSIELYIVDVNGRRILEQQYNTEKDHVRLNHNLVSGFYYVTLTDGERFMTRKLVVY